jgi:NhaP-type Na+/H+ or K+/H+ antiporter
VWFVPLLLLVIRPFSVVIGLAGADVPAQERWLAAWFGIRGIGSMYYLMFAVVHGMRESDARILIGITLAVITTSVVTHGVSVTPLMNKYSRVGRGL